MAKPLKNLTREEAIELLHDGDVFQLSRQTEEHGLQSAIVSRKDVLTMIRCARALVEPGPHMASLGYRVASISHDTDNNDFDYIMTDKPPSDEFVEFWEALPSEGGE